MDKALDEAQMRVVFVVLALLLLWGYAGPAYAMEERLGLDLSIRETYDTSIDYGVDDGDDNDEDSGLVTNVSSGLSYTASDPATQYGANLDLNQRFDHGDSDNNRTNGSLGLSAAHAVSERLSTNFSSNFRVDHSQEESATEFGIVVEPQLRYSLALSAGAGYSLDELNSLNGGISHNRQIGDGEDLADTQSYGLNGSWSRSISEVSSVGLSTGLGHSLSERENTDTTSNYLNFRINYNYAYTEDWTFNFGIGPSFSRTETEEEIQLGNTIIEREETNYVTTYSVSSGANWRINERTNSRFTFSRGQTQSILGDNVINYRFSSNISYQLGEKSDISAGFNYSRSSATGDDEESENENYGISTSYGYSLTENLRLSVSYSYNEQHDITDDNITTRQRFAVGLSTSLETLLD